MPTPVSVTATTACSPSRFERELDGASRRRVLDRVLDQVDDGAPERQMIPVDDERLDGTEADDHAAPVRQPRPRVDHVHEQRLELDRVSRKDHLHA